MNTNKYAVIGHPIGHSLSPFIHEKLFELDNIDAEYTAIDIENLDTDYESVLKTLSGYNVTIPHKQNIIKKLDKISDKAMLCNSVNTVKNGETAQGYTTDGYGFVAAVCAKTNGVIPENVLIFGCGGAARAITFECIAHACKLSFAVREDDLQMCYELQDEIYQKLGVKVQVFTTDKVSELENIGLLVNATPVGMYPHSDGCIASDDIIKKAEAVFDCVYNPLETVLLKKAREFHKNAIGSIDMLVYQAAKAHEIWVGAQYTNDQLQIICKQTADQLR